MQNNGGFGASVAMGSDYSFPAINGQTNRSDFFLMDGLYDYGALKARMPSRRSSMPSRNSRSSRIPTTPNSAPCWAAS